MRRKNAVAAKLSWTWQDIDIILVRAGYKPDEYAQDYIKKVLLNGWTKFEDIAYYLDEHFEFCEENGYEGLIEKLGENSTGEREVDYMNGFLDDALHKLLKDYVKDSKEGRQATRANLEEELRESPGALRYFIKAFDNVDNWRD